eukprot:CAMPEP_0182874346 /NCGR_PEP_ID=MMETSP0034_2-20130328/12887_1 /TAXON_ID=156128 /ORGANISM="Nephroselmis pyriformis, Strain CCMP717" /LENGTH=343 /DNA_ID=CAMNT_0025007053 /DNA_START=168 /DNA_END=1195 /DNA_ORIENTATION=+
MPSKAQFMADFSKAEYGTDGQGRSEDDTISVPIVRMEAPVIKMGRAVSKLRLIGRISGGMKQTRARADAKELKKTLVTVGKLHGLDETKWQLVHQEEIDVTTIDAKDGQDGARVGLWACTYKGVKLHLFYELPLYDPRMVPPTRPPSPPGVWEPANNNKKGKGGVADRGRLESTGSRNLLDLERRNSGLPMSPSSPGPQGPPSQPTTPRTRVSIADGLAPGSRDGTPRDPTFITGTDMEILQLGEEPEHVITCEGGAPWYNVKRVYVSSEEQWGNLLEDRPWTTEQWRGKTVELLEAKLRQEDPNLQWEGAHGLWEMAVQRGHHADLVARESILDACVKVLAR